MNKDKSDKNWESGGCDVKEKVLRSIRQNKIRIRRPFVFVAERLGLESALIAAIITGALTVSVILYFLKKSGIFFSERTGMPDVKMVMLALPYDYIALFIFTMLLAIYLANRIEIFCGNCERTNKFALYFFLATVVLGIFFAVMGVGDFLAK